MEQTIKDRVLDLARQGVSYYEIERTLGVQHAVASKWARNAGIKRGRGGGCVSKANEERKKERLLRIRDVFAGRFEVLSLEPKGQFVLKCLECGFEFNNTTVR